ncbi:cytochrome c oxidase accessory protein CcoG [Ideonella sp. BN130291]|uniref:cytochrome c oxidase accessory protein CcoG n=1 Tax=Ideonella sp. BN130291 TaxID=3112940 RepID=UPI002E26B672|nr:cytochrome c oxidase accessory protein CcoG [Ideonella sp. BN130291]
MSQGVARVIPIQPAANDGQLVSLYAKQEKIYPRAVHGWFAAWRWALVWLTQALFYGLAWLPWNGRQALLFDLASRRFYIFDLVLYPQDFIYLTGLLVVSAFSLFFFTALAGRLWCGYACPQTVYTEIFLWVERHLEGDRMQRLKLDASPWSATKLLRKGGKQVIWIAIALWTGFTFVGYFTPIRTLAAEALQFSFGPWEWFWVLFYGFATYGNAGYLREQVCKYMCPYARFQGAMIDRDTMIISYDTARGDPRGTRARSADLKTLGLGDCIDCGLCVQVCPTGIDIRDGLQSDCIGCAACIDVCNGVMDKMHYPHGLIRYATQNGMTQKLTRAQMLRRALRPRVLVYGTVLIAIVGALGTSLALRQPFRVDVVRDRTSLARMVEDGRIENVYRLQVMNATEAPQRYRVGVKGLEQARINGATELEVPAAGARWFAVAVQVPHETARKAHPGAHPMQFEIERLGPDGHHSDAEVSEKSTFVVPR